MQVMLHTGYINYETFAGDERDNPIEKGTIYDISTPEKERAAKIAVLRADGDDTPLLDFPEKPKEPKFSLTQAKDAAYIEEQTEKYEKSLSHYEAAMADYKVQLDFLEGLERGETPEIGEAALNALFDEYTEYYEREAVARIYYYDMNTDQ